MQKNKFDAIDIGYGCPVVGLPKNYTPLIEKYIGTIDYQAGDKIAYTDFGRSGSAYGSAIHHIKKQSTK